MTDLDEAVKRTTDVFKADNWTYCTPEEWAKEVRAMLLASGLVERAERAEAHANQCEARMHEMAEQDSEAIYRRLEEELYAQRRAQEAAYARAMKAEDALNARRQDCD